MANNINNVNDDVIPVSVITQIKYSECEDDVQAFPLSLFDGILTQEVVAPERVKNSRVTDGTAAEGPSEAKNDYSDPGKHISSEVDAAKKVSKEHAALK